MASDFWTSGSRLGRSLPVSEIPSSIDPDFYVQKLNVASSIYFVSVSDMLQAMVQSSRRADPALVHLSAPLVQ